MTTASIPFTNDIIKELKKLISEGYGSNLSDIIRKAVQEYLENKAVERILKAEKEPSLSGNLNDLLEKI